MPYVDLDEYKYFTFTFAYIIASTGIISLITFYSRSVLSDKFHTFIVLFVLIVLYSYLYIILQLQDYALLMGSVVLFIALALTMYFNKSL